MSTRIFLVSEAAHLFAPFGARGMNSGITDAGGRPPIRHAFDAPAAGPTQPPRPALARGQGGIYEVAESSRWTVAGENAGTHTET